MEIQDKRVTPGVRLDTLRPGEPFTVDQWPGTVFLMLDGNRIAMPDTDGRLPVVNLYTGMVCRMAAHINVQRADARVVLR